MQTATNPQTGERAVLVGSEWKPIAQSATGPDGRKAYLVGDSWLQDDPAPAAPKPEGPSDARVALNATSKAIAGIPDSILNTPTRVWNLLKAGAGTVATAAGKPDLAPNLSEEPDYAKRLLTKLGAIRPEAEPTNSRQRVIDAATQGATGMMINPASTARQVASNVATGTLAGGAAGVTKETTGSDEAAILAGLVVPGAVQGAGNAARAKVADALVKKGQAAESDKVLADARKEGYVVPPASVNPSFLNNRLESLAGKAAIKQQAGQDNQTITNTIAARELGMPPETAITPGKLDAYRHTEAAPYREVAALSNNAKQFLEMLKQSRVDANDWWKFYGRTGDPSAKAKAESLTQAAEAMEIRIQSIAAKAGKPSLVDDLKAARTKIAKAWDIDRALNLGDAGVSAPTLGRAYDKGAPFTDGLETISKFAEGPGRQFVTEGSRIPAPGVSGTELYGQAGLGAAGHAVAGPAGGFLAAGIPLLRGPVRSLLLSKAYQESLGKPNREAGITARAASKIPQQDALIQAILMGRTMVEQE